MTSLVTAASDPTAILGIALTKDTVAALFNLLSALIGAVVGALATGFVTRQLGRRAQSEQQRGQDDVGAFSVQQKLIAIYSSTFDIIAHFRKARVQQKKMRSDPKVWNPHIGVVFRPFANFTADQEFTVAELYSLNRMGRHELLSSVAGLDRLHNALNESLRVFAKRRDQLVDAWTGQAGSEGVVYRAVSEAEYKANEHRFIELDNLVEQLEPMAAELLDDCVKAVGAVTRAQGRYLGQRISVTLHQLDGPDLTFKSIEEPEAWFRGLLSSLSG